MDDHLGPIVAARLRAVMEACHVSGNREMAELCGATTSAVNNWRLGNNLPRVPEMIRLAGKTGITLDWVYRGFVGSMDPGLALRLDRLAAAQGDVRSRARSRANGGAGRATRKAT